jgi:hypothetical protein
MKYRGLSCPVPYPCSPQALPPRGLRVFVPKPTRSFEAAQHCAMRGSYAEQTNALEQLLRDLASCQGEKEVDDLIRQAPHAPLKRADSADDMDVELSSLASLTMEGKYAVGASCYAKYYVDGLFYKAIVQSKTERSYMVEFTEYGNTQDTYEADILEEEVALAFAGGGAVEASPPMMVCHKCKTDVPVSLTFCNECGFRLDKRSVEDPDARAARLALELTSWGTCNECHSTIMMSDEICLICGLERGAPKVGEGKRADRQMRF